MIYTFENAYFPCTKDKFNVIVWKYFQSTSITFFLFSQKQKVLFIMLNIITHNKTSFSSNFELTFIQNGWHNRQQQNKFFSPGKLNMTLCKMFLWLLHIATFEVVQIFWFIWFCKFPVGLKCANYIFWTRMFLSSQILLNKGIEWKGDPCQVK